MAKGLRLVSLQKPVSNGALAGAQLPTRIKVLSWGLNKTLKGDVVVNEHTRAIFNSNQRKIGRERAPIDWDHNTVKDTDAFKALEGRPPVIFGYGTPTLIDGDGIWFEDIEWTPDGQKMARNYSDLSPTPLLDDDNQVLAVHSCALTPAGAVDGLTFYSAFASLETFTAQFMSPLSTATDPSTPPAYVGARKLVDNQGLTKKGQMNKEHFDYFRSHLKLDADMDDDGVRKHVLKHMALSLGLDADADADADESGTMIKHLAAVMGWVKSNPDPNNRPFMNQFPSEGGPVYHKLVAEVRKEFAGQITTLSAEIKAMKDNQADTVAKAEQAQKDSLVQAAVAKGLSVPFDAETIKTLSVSQLEHCIKNLKPVPVATARKAPVLNAEPQKKTLRDSAAAIDRQIEGATQIRPMAI